MTFAQKQELLFFEDFENSEMSSLCEYASVDVSGIHSTKNAISGNGSLEVNTLGKKGVPTTIKLDSEKIRISDKQSTLITISFKYKILGVDGDRNPRNYVLCETNGKRVFTEVFGENVGKCGFAASRTAQNAENGTCGNGEIEIF